MTVNQLLASFIAVPPRAVKITWALILGVPIAALSISWFQFFRNRRGPTSGGSIAKLSLLALTVSYLFFLSGSWVWVWGPYYSNRRYLTIGVNLAFSALIFLIASLRMNRLTIWVVLSAVVIALLWLYAGAINSVV